MQSHFTSTPFLMLIGTCTETTKAVLFKHLHLSCTIYFSGENFRSEYKQICEMQSHFTSTPFLMLIGTCTETTKAVLFKHLHLSCTIYFRGDNFRSEYKQICEMQSHFTSTPFLMLTGTCTETTKAVLFKHLHLSCTIYFRGDNFRSEYKQVCEMQSHFTSTPFLMLIGTCTETTKAVLFKHLHLSCTIYFSGDNFRSEYKQICEMQSHFTSMPFLMLTGTCTETTKAVLFKHLHLSPEDVHIIAIQCDR